MCAFTLSDDEYNDLKEKNIRQNEWTGLAVSECGSDDYKLDDLPVDLPFEKITDKDISSMTIINYLPRGTGPRTSGMKAYEESGLIVCYYFISHQEDTMRFRPCIDIHNGSVKQIVGGSLADKGNKAQENFVSSQDGAYYGELYRTHGLNGGHIIILNPEGSEYYQADAAQAYSALSAFEGGLQIGGGINDKNATAFLDKGASHVIVTSFVFRGGEIDMHNLTKMKNAVGKNRLVLDLSCRRRGDSYYIVTDRWQKFTDVKLTAETLEDLSRHCDEFLIHAVDVEGKAKGIEENVAAMLADTEIPSTYAGGISSFDDLEKLKALGRGRIDFTVGSALDIFGGSMAFEDVARFGN